MKDIEVVLRELTEGTNIKIRLTEMNNLEIFDNLPLSAVCVCRKIKINDKLFKIYLEKDDIKILPLIEYILNKSYFEDNIIERILEEKVQWPTIDKTSIGKSGKMILIESEKINEVLEIVRATHLDEKIYIGKVYSSSYSMFPIIIILSYTF
ncbi:hypothetical protein KQI16_11095, partial [Caproiciproducens sp. MSJ-32]|nr:hypothetical protein [Caproiciproducens sp. MSJ-32]